MIVDERDLARDHLDDCARRLRSLHHPANAERRRDAMRELERARAEFFLASENVALSGHPLEVA